MCIICIKKKGIKFPSVECVKTMCDNNNHGFAIAISNGRKAKVIKTLNEDKFIRVYQNLVKKYDWANTTMFIHARIKTHGTQRIENCHGWKENGLIFAHNGILSIQNRDDLTDSETFFRDIFSPAYKIGGWKLGEKAIQAIIGTSKFVFMDDRGNIHHYGHYIEDDGLLFSNSTYLNHRYQFNNRRYSYVDEDWWNRRVSQLEADEWNQALRCDDYPF